MPTAIEDFLLFFNQFLFARSYCADDVKYVYFKQGTYRIVVALGGKFEKQKKENSLIWEGVVDCCDHECCSFFSWNDDDRSSFDCYLYNTKKSLTVRLHLHGCHFDTLTSSTIYFPPHSFVHSNYENVGCKFLSLFFLFFVDGLLFVCTTTMPENLHWNQIES